MKTTIATKFAVIMTAVSLSLLAGCSGGGGGGGGPSGIGDTTSQPLPGPVVTASTDSLQGLTISPLSLGTGIVVPFSGPLDPTKTTVVVSVGGNQVNGTVTFGNNNQSVIFKPTVRLPFGKSVTETITAVDTFGRTVQTTVSFSTGPMICVDSAIWSNPAVFSISLKNCVAQVGEMALITPNINTVQDNSCTITVGTALSSSCKAYLENGTMLITDTSMVVNGHKVNWDAYIGTDGKSNIVLLDTNDPSATPVPLGTLVLPTNLVSVIGNPTGESIRVTTTVNGVNRTEQVTWNATSSSLTATCLFNCA